MRRRDTLKATLQETACERLLGLFLSARGSRPERREVRRILFADCPGITGAIFERAWNEASRRSAVAAPPTAGFRSEQDGPAPELHDI